MPVELLLWQIESARVVHTDHKVAALVYAYHTMVMLV